MRIQHDTEKRPRRFSRHSASVSLISSGRVKWPFLRLNLTVSLLSPQKRSSNYSISSLKMQYTRKEKHFHFIPGFRISLPTPRFPKNQQRYSKNKISRKMTITRRTPSQTTLFLEGSPPLPRERATSPLPDSLQPALRAARTLPIPMQNKGTWFSDALPTNAPDNSASKAD